MRRKTKIALMIVMSVEVVLVVLIGLLLVSARARLGTASKGLKDAWSALVAIYHRNPFPERSNVEAMRRNRDDLEKEVKSLLDQMRKGQLPAADEGDSPLQWVARLSKMQNDLRTRAIEARITMPEKFAFGFDKYDDGRPPPRNAVPRLSKQLKIVERICSVLYEAEAKEVAKIKRVEFESISASSPARGRTEAPAAESGAEDKELTDEAIFETLYKTPERFTFEFGAKEANLVRALNSLAKDPMFVVVASMEITSNSGVVQDGQETTVDRRKYRRRALAGGDPDNLFPEPEEGDEDVRETKQNVDSRKRPQRIVSGKAQEANANIVMTIDVYTFRRPSS